MLHFSEEEMKPPKGIGKSKNYAYERKHTALKGMEAL
jgi:hypothetical protein